MVVKDPFVDVPAAYGITSRTTDAAVTDALSMLVRGLGGPWGCMWPGCGNCRFLVISR